MAGQVCAVGWACLDSVGRVQGLISHAYCGCRRWGSVHTTALPSPCQVVLKGSSSSAWLFLGDAIVPAPAWSSLS